MPGFYTKSAEGCKGDNHGGQGGVEINVFFWDPHSMVGPGSADTYAPYHPVD